MRQLLNKDTKILEMKLSVRYFGCNHVIYSLDCMAGQSARRDFFISMAKTGHGFLDFKTHLVQSVNDSAMDR